jgi:hypothetical protein
VDDAEACFRLRQQIREEFGKLERDIEIPKVEDDLDDEPLTEGWGSYGDFQLVGCGRQTNGSCGLFKSRKVCLREDLHRLITLDGVNFAGKVFVRKYHSWCHRPSCPTCYRHGWAIREATTIEARLKEASKRFGQVEHIVVSVAVRDYGLKYESLRKKVDRALFNCGIVGGVKIFHGFRYNLRKHWFWSVHFHVLGFVLGGYSRCRHCKGGNCYSCDGVEGKCYRLYRENGWIVRVLGERKTIFGTAWYQLHHSTVDVTKKRFHVATWMGVCSYKKLRVTVEVKKAVCPICQHELVDGRYFGEKVFVTNRSSVDYRRDSFEDFLEHGREVWAECVKSKKWGGSYEE